MKKKIASLFLMAAALVVAVGTFVSCKDNEDDYLNLQSQFDSDLSEAVAAQEAALQAAEQELQNQLDDLEDELDSLDKAIQEKLDAIEECSCSGYATESELEALKDELTALINEHAQCACDLSNIETAIETINTTLSNLSSTLGDLGDQVDANTTSIATLSGTVDQNSSDIEKLYELYNAAATVEDLTDLSVKVTSIETQVTGLSDSVSSAWAKLEEDSTYIADLQESVETINTSLEGILERLATAETDITGLKSSVEDLESEYSALSDSLSDLYDTVSELSESLDTQIEEVKALIDEEVSALETAIADGDAATLATAQAYADSIETVLQDQIDAVAADIEDLQDQIDALDEKIDDLTGRVEALEADMLARYVTSIIVQGTENDCFGTFALPLGIRSNILMGYHGYWTPNGGTFPTTASAQTVDNEQYLSEEVLEILQQAGLETESFSSGDPLGLNEDGNIDAGTLYLTVNPTNVDFNDLTVTLENSQGEESGVELSALEESDDLLTFGYTRSSSNGFYETHATIPYENIDDVKVNVESGLKSEMASAVKAAISGSAISFSSLISTIYDQFNGILPAEAVKTSWTDEESDEEYSVYSEYGVAATTIKPLSFKFLGNTSYSIPTISTISQIDLGDFDISIELDGITIDPEDIELAPIEFTNVSYNVGTFVITVKYEYEKAVVDVESGEITYETVEDSVSADITDDLQELVNGLTETIGSEYSETVTEYVDDAINEIISQLNAQLDTMISNINSQLDDINSLVDQFNGLQETLDDYVDLINTYISRINTVINRINGYLTNANDYLQVALMYESEDGGMGIVSNSQTFSTGMSAGSTMVLHPTTYTAEIAVPCCKKFVAVTNVLNGATGSEDALSNDDLKALMIAANQDNSYLNTVLDGNTRAISFAFPSGAESGQIYEITYAAFDYNGYTSYNKYYIRVQ